MGSTLTTFDGGRIIQEANGSTYVCSVLELSMAVNTIPTAAVMVHCGTPLRENATSIGNAEQLYKKMLTAQASNRLDMLECKIYEVNTVGTDSRKTLIFSGVIGSGKLVYRSGTSGMRGIQFTCFNKACKLYTAPQASYTNMGVANFIQAATDNASFSASDAMNNASLFVQGPEGVKQDVIENATKELTGTKTLDKIVDVVVNEIIKAGTYQTGDTGTPKSGFSDYITSGYAINANAFGSSGSGGSMASSVLESFIESLATRLLQSMQANSIYAAVASVVVSSEFMLNFLPKWSDADFKVELSPSFAWNNKIMATIPAKYILSVGSGYNAVEALNNPEGFIVNFSSAVETSQGEVLMDYLGANGAFSTNPTVQKILDAKYSGGKGAAADKALSAQYIKAKFYEAPKWLHVAFEEMATNGDTPTKVSEQKTSKEQGSDGTAQTDSVNKASMDVKKGQPQAQKIAQALYSYFYGAQDTATVVLDSRVRFGYSSDIKKPQESLIGQIIELQFTDYTGGSMNLCGMLTALSYSYSADMTSSSSYSITLTRVRPTSTQTESIDCPLYKKV